MKTEAKTPRQYWATPVLGLLDRRDERITGIDLKATAIAALAMASPSSSGSWSRWLGAIPARRT